ncbi:MAG: hypothetical protein ACP5OC_02335 [Thermoplasmata archaeon]
MPEGNNRFRTWLPIIVAVVIVAAGLGVPYGLGIVTFTHSQKHRTQQTSSQ